MKTKDLHQWDNLNLLSMLDIFMYKMEKVIYEMRIKGIEYDRMLYISL